MIPVARQPRPPSNWFLGHLTPRLDDRTVPVPRVPPADSRRARKARLRWIGPCTEFGQHQRLRYTDDALPPRARPSRLRLALSRGRLGASTGGAFGGSNLASRRADGVHIATDGNSLYKT